MAADLDDVVYQLELIVKQLGFMEKALDEVRIEIGRLGDRLDTAISSAVVDIASELQNEG